MQGEARLHREGPHTSLADLLYVSVVVFALAIVFTVVYDIQSVLFPALKTQLDQTNNAADSVITSVQGVFPIFDDLLLIGFFGSMVGMLILAWLLPTNPLMMGVLVVGMMAVFVVTPVLANSYLNVAAAMPHFDASISFPYTYYLLSNYPIFIMGFGFLLLVILVARFRSGSNE